LGGRRAGSHRGPEDPASADSHLQGRAIPNRARSIDPTMQIPEKVARVSGYAPMAVGRASGERLSSGVSAAPHPNPPPQEWGAGIEARCGSCFPRPLDAGESHLSIALGWKRDSEGPFSL